MTKEGQDLGLPHLPRIVAWSLRARVALVLGMTAAYALIFVALRGVLGSGVSALSLAPVAMAGLLFGLRVGLLAATLAFLLNLLLLGLVGQSVLEAMLQEGGAAGSLALLMVGAVVGWLSDLREQLSREIHDRKQAEEALERERRRLFTVLDSLPAVVFLCRPDYSISFANRRFRDLFGEPGERPCYATFHGRREPCEVCYLSQVIETGLPEVWEWTSPGGRTYVIYADLSPTVDGRDAVLEICFDITERKRAEEALRESREQLLRQERLAAVGQLAGGIAHDFNNVLTSIILSTQILLSRRRLPRDMASNIEAILDESQRAAKLVQQILDFSRRAMIRVRPLDLVSCVEETVDILERTLPASIRLMMEWGEGEWMVEADPARIQQALINLAANARDAMPEGGRLHVALSRLEVGEDGPPLPGMACGKWLCLAVSDTGTGMTEEVRSHLFEPFFTTKEPGAGTGLGLAQVHGIVKQHGGHIGVETEPGNGTAFRIYLPALDGRAAAGEGEQGRGEKILLVEDEERLREAGREILESLGYRVLAAANGRQALDLYRTGEADLLITDLVMPEIGGRELLQELRKVSPGLRALAITGYTVEQDLEVLREEGFVEVVHKPFDVAALARAVRRALEVDEE